ncbi:MAG: tetratricopeptide repeat protein [Pirellulaceae bacterium]
MNLRTPNTTLLIGLIPLGKTLACWFKLGALRYTLWLITLLAVACSAGQLRAENEGQPDLDQAVDLKLEAESMEDLEKVAELCESALEKGLGEEDQRFAKQLLTSVRYQRAETYARNVLESAQQRRDWQSLRKQAIEELDKGLKVDDSVGMLHFLKGRLLLLPEGDRDQAIKSIEKSIELLEGSDEQLSQALMISATLTDDREQQLKRLGRAIEADENNANAFRARGLMYLEAEEYEKAMEDLKVVVDRSPGDLTALQAYAETFVRMEKFDEAIKLVDGVVDANPNAPVGYLLRARLKVLADDTKGALEDLDQVLVMAPRSIPALMMRAGLYFESEDVDSAIADTNRVLRLDGNNVQAILLRSTLYAAQEKYTEAIRDLETILRQDDDNYAVLLQIGFFHQANKKPRKAIEIFDQVLKKDPNNLMAIRSRSDAMLSVGDHKGAIQGYEKAMAIKNDDDGILNNYAWVLATSPQDEVRDGEKSIELAKKACEVTEYSRPHILSTLAAAYAETGDFENAKKWSQKALDIADGDPEMVEHLEKELESFKQEKPWREIQEDPEVESTPTEKPTEEKPETENSESDEAKPSAED